MRNIPIVTKNLLIVNVVAFLACMLMDKSMHVFGQSGVLTWATYYTSYNFEYDWWRMDLNEIDGLVDGTYTLRPIRVVSATINPTVTAT